MDEERKNSRGGSTVSLNGTKASIGLTVMSLVRQGVRETVRDKYRLMAVQALNSLIIITLLKIIVGFSTVLPEGCYYEGKVGI